MLLLTLSLQESHLNFAVLLEKALWPEELSGLGESGVCGLSIDEVRCGEGGLSGDFGGVGFD